KSPPPRPSSPPPPPRQQPAQWPSVTADEPIPRGQRPGDQFRQTVRKLLAELKSEPWWGWGGGLHMGRRAGGWSWRSLSPGYAPSHHDRGQAGAGGRPNEGFHPRRLVRHTANTPMLRQAEAPQRH